MFFPPQAVEVRDPHGHQLHQEVPASAEGAGHPAQLLARLRRRRQQPELDLRRNKPPPGQSS